MTRRCANSTPGRKKQCVCPCMAGPDGGKRHAPAHPLGFRPTILPDLVTILTGTLANKSRTCCSAFAKFALLPVPSPLPPPPRSLPRSTRPTGVPISRVRPIRHAAGRLAPSPVAAARRQHAPHPGLRRHQPAFCGRRRGRGARACVLARVAQTRSSWARGVRRAAAGRRQLERRARGCRPHAHALRHRGGGGGGRKKRQGVGAAVAVADCGGGDGGSGGMVDVEAGKTRRVLCLAMVGGDGGWAAGTVV
jgi:hypothetical protein